MTERPDGPFRSPEPESPPPAAAPPATPAAEPPAAPVATAPEAEPAEGDQDGLDDEDAPIEAWKLILAVGGLFVVITVIGLIAFVAFGDDESDTGGGDSPDTNASSIVDGFDRDDSNTTLGTTDTGEKWEAVSGTWGIKDQQAALITPNDEGPRSIAVLDMKSPNGTIQVTGSTITNGWGLVFRYRSPFNYWYITGSRDTASYTIVKASNADGEITNETVEQINLANTKDGAVVKVELIGSAINVYVDGTLRATVNDEHNLNATKVGLLAAGEAPKDARWDDFTATPNMSVTQNTPAGGAPAGGSVPAGGAPAGGSVPASGATVAVPAPPADASVPTTAAAEGGG